MKNSYLDRWTVDNINVSPYSSSQLKCNLCYQVSLLMKDGSFLRLIVSDPYDIYPYCSSVWMPFALRYSFFYHSRKYYLNERSQHDLRKSFLVKLTLLFGERYE